MRLTVNGEQHEIHSPPLTSLLTVLREELDITSPKAGCQQGGCGACTVLVDGEPRRSCLAPLAAVDGASITTVEGLGAADDLSPVQAAFDEHYAAQCGFCTPGFIMAATALIERRAAEGDREEMLEALGGHVLPLHRLHQDRQRGRGGREGRGPSRAGRAELRARGGGSADSREPGMKAVGARLPRYDGVATSPAGRSTSTTSASAGTLWVKALRSPHHNAAITRLDTSEGRGAEGRPRGRHRTRTSRRTSTATSRGSASRPTSRCSPTDEVRYKGQPIAAVAAESRGDRARGGRGDRDRVRGAAGALRHPQGARPRRAADPPVGQRLSALRPVQPPPRAQGRHRLGVRRGGRDRRGRLPPAGDRADADRDAGRARRPGGERAADDLLVHAGDVLLDGRRRGAPPGAAEQAEVRRRHRRRRLRRQGRHGDARRSARCSRSRRGGRSSGAGRARRSSSPRRRARRGTWSSPTRSRATAGSSAAGC